MLNNDYDAVLNRLGLVGVERGPWLVVGRSPLVQGWKLHISCTPVDALALLSAVVPFLAGENISFKFARSLGILGQLNEGELGGTQIGKFITVYPDSDRRAREVAEGLIRLTNGFEGPTVVTDLELGDVVYARYGGHNPVTIRDRLGQLILSIYAPDGKLRPDSYAVPYRVPQGVANPFNGMIRTRSTTPTVIDEAGRRIRPKSAKLFGPGYLVLDVVKEHPKGSVFRSIDLRSRDLVAAKILKQGRRLCLCDEWGRDMRSRLRRQQALHGLLHSRVPVPNSDGYFEVDGDGYLPLEYIEGRSIETVAAEMLKHKPWTSVPFARRTQMLDYLKRLLCAVETLHEAGYVHRDLTASNVWIGNNQKVYLLDLELAHGFHDSSPPIGLGTPGFMSPQQEHRQRPSLADDVYSLGCVFILALTGIDPRRILFGCEQHRVEQLTMLTGGVATPLLRVIARAVQADASQRPSITEIQSAVDVMASDGRQTFRVGAVAHGDAIQKGIAGLLGGVPCDVQTGVWLSPSLRSSNHLGASRSAGALELRRSANRGVAGVVYLLSRAAQLGYASQELRRSVQCAVDWLIDLHDTPDAGMAGLHFGEAGVALAICEALAASLVSPSAKTLTFIRKGLSGPLDWPDITHGAAGQGIAALCCSDLLADPDLAVSAHASAEYLIATQQPDGSWVMPSGVDGMSGQRLTGFAHGVAGMVYFLAEYSHRFRSNRAQQAWHAGVEWLDRRAIPARGSVQWDYSDAQPTRWNWWCHGGPGIALAYLRLYELTRDDRFARVARQALLIHPMRLRYPNLTQCHGLSGLGDIYLEAARVLGDRTWVERASKIADFLLSLCRVRDNTLTWLTEDPHLPSADLMVGAGGVVHFLLRLYHRGCAPSFALLPSDRVRCDGNSRTRVTSLWLRHRAPAIGGDKAVTLTP